ncbi:MAG: 30S ribosomal protein S6 [Candidatus Kapaibacterium sp.]
MDNAKRNYEIYIIVDGNFEDPTVEEIISKYEKLLVKNGTEIINIDRMGRKRLAYPIKKKVNGNYICFEVLAPADVVGKLEKTFRIDENILRHLAVLMTKKELKEKNEYFVKKAATLAAFEAQKAAEEKASKEKEAEVIAETPVQGEVTA